MSCVSVNVNHVEFFKVESPYWGRSALGWDGRGISETSQQTVRWVELNLEREDAGVIFLSFNNPSQSTSALPY